MKTVQITFFGLCFFDQSTHKRRVRVLMPDATGCGTHADGEEKVPHEASLYLPATQVGDTCVLGENQTGSDCVDYRVIPLGGGDTKIRIKADLEKEWLRPRGGRAHLPNLVDFRFFAPLKLRSARPYVRLDLKYGSLEQGLLTPDLGGGWEVPRIDSRTPRVGMSLQYVAWTIVWTAKIEQLGKDNALLSIDGYDLCVNPEASCYDLGIGNVDGDVAPLIPWDLAPPQGIGPLEDTDFRWFYELFEDLGDQADWPRGKLPVPSTDASAIPTPTCFPGGC